MLITFLVVLLVLAIVCAIINYMPFIPANIKPILYLVAALLAVVSLVGGVGIWH